MRFLLLVLALCFSVLSWGQGTTSSEMRGIVTDANGEPLIGANVVAVHLPSGTTFGTATNLDGYYQIPGMRVGGPYNVTASYTGYSSVNLENVELRLGETFRRDFALDEANVELEAVMVVAASGVTGQTAGTSTSISTEKIEAVPTLNRDIDDYLKLTPQANSYGDGISLAGINNRFNAIYIDGAVNNDMYGIATSGTNGGQTGIAPFSIDIIDQFQVVLSPYDVSLGGFAGGGINAVTKSGTNKMFATAYYFLQNESLAGKTHGIIANRLNLADSLRTKLPDFTKNTFGASLGGPIIKDKLFFFANVEIQNDETPLPYEVEQYTSVAGRADTNDLEALRTHLINNFNYDPGTYRDAIDEVDGLKLFGKLDFNLNENHRLTLRHQYTKAEQFDRNIGSTTTINFSNNGVYFPSTTNSSAAELKSRFGQNTSNDLIIGYTTVLDDRDGIGDDFPFLIIQDSSSGFIRLGTEEFSTANLLEQSVLTLTDNFKIYKGNHTITLGTHNEFSSFNNVFIGSNFGTYTFSSLEAFLAGSNAINYERSYSLVDEENGDATAAAADFNAMQLGFYAQDQWSISPQFTLTGGLRLDIPVITTDPALDELLADSLAKMATFYPIASNVTVGEAPEGQLMFSPRLGFEYAFDDSRKTILRGGLGVFTSRIPFVWPGAMFTNNGLTIGRVTGQNLGGSIPFVADENDQYENDNFSIPSGQVDLFVNDFKYPQVFRTNLALDTEFGDGFEFSIEGLFTKTMNNVLYTNINSDPTEKFKFTGTGGDTRSVYNNRSITRRYSAVYVASNTSEGYTYNFTASLAKNFGQNFNAFLAYNYGDAYSINDGTSSQNSSQWRGQININGRNNPVLGRSDFAQGHRFIAVASYKIPWTKAIGTSISLFYTGESGEAFSYVIGGGSSAQNINNDFGSTGRNRALVYVPIDMNDINLQPYTTSAGTVSVETQWENLNAMIESDPGLSERRGQYVEKNGSFAPFNHILDLAIKQDLGTDLGGDLHRIQISLDILNLPNLLNKEWGAYYVTPGSDFNNFQLYQFDGYDANEISKPKFSYRLGSATGKDIFSVLGTESRWRMRLGFRYILN